METYVKIIGVIAIIIALIYIYGQLTKDFTKIKNNLNKFCSSKVSNSFWSGNLNYISSNQSQQLIVYCIDDSTPVVGIYNFTLNSLK